MTPLVSLIAAAAAKTSGPKIYKAPIMGSAFALYRQKMKAQVPRPLPTLGVAASESSTPVPVSAGLVLEGTSHRTFSPASAPIDVLATASQVLSVTMDKVNPSTRVQSLVEVAVSGGIPPPSSVGEEVVASEALACDGLPTISFIPHVEELRQFAKASERARLLRFEHALANTYEDSLYRSLLASQVKSFALT